MFAIKIILGILIYLGIGVFVAVFECDKYIISYGECGLTVVIWPIVLVGILIFCIIGMCMKLFEFIGRPVYKLSKKIREKRGK